MMGLEPTTSRATIWRSNRLSYNRHVERIVPRPRGRVKPHCVQISALTQRKVRSSSGISGNPRGREKDQRMNDLWVLAGQSNMEGCGRLSDIEAPHEQVRVFAQGDYWQVAEEPLHWLLEAVNTFHHGGRTGEELEQARRETRANRQTGAGLGLAFAKAVHDATGHPIDLLPVAHGGTSMQQWSPDLKGQGGASLYGAMLRRVHLALETGGETRLRGILWYQGESDANPMDAAVYTDRMTKLIQSMREDLNSPDLPFFFVQLGCFANSDTDTSGSRAWDEVREAQRVLPDLIARTGVVPAIDLELDDGIHIGTQGLKRLGRRLASVALNRVYGQGTPDGILLRSAVTEGGILRVSYEGVSTGLRVPDLAQRVSGYAVGMNGGIEPNVIYKAAVDPMSPSDVLLSLREPLPLGASLYYGHGYNPFCQLTDAADMAVPAMGPIPIS